jgi:hypothetical protein
VALVQQRLSAKLGRRVDAEDIVLSAYRRFVVGARAGRFRVERGGDLRRVLAGIAIHKLHGQVERHTAGKRALDRQRQPEELAEAGGLPTHGRLGFQGRALTAAAHIGLTRASFLSVCAERDESPHGVSRG